MKTKTILIRLIVLGAITVLPLNVISLLKLDPIFSKAILLCSVIIAISIVLISRKETRGLKDDIKNNLINKL